MYQKRNELEILSLFIKGNLTRLYLRQISKMAKLPLKTTQNALSALEGMHILRSTVEGKNKYFSINFDNIQAKHYILQAEAYKTCMLLESYPLKMFVKSLDVDAPIICFGSFAKFKADKNSDLDLLIISDKEQKLPYHLLPYKPHPISLSKESFGKAIEINEPLIKEVMNSHVILNDHSFYVNLAWNHLRSLYMRSL